MTWSKTSRRSYRASSVPVNATGPHPYWRRSFATPSGVGWAARLGVLVLLIAASSFGVMSFWRGRLLPSYALLGRSLPLPGANRPATPTASVALSTGRDD